jgi:pilus assembly protein CpaF
MCRVHARTSIDRSEETSEGEWMSTDALGIVRRQLREQLRQRVDARGLANAPRTERRVRVREEALALLRESGAILPQRELARVVNEVSDEVVGFGPIEFLLKDPEVTEVMVNGPDDVYVEREGRIERAPDGLFEGEGSVLHLIERIVGPLGLRVDESSPWADARLPDGSRVHAIVPPLSLRGPTLTIRKFSPVPFEAEDLVASGSVGPRMLRFLAACVRGRANVIVSGGTGSGKTTLLGVLSGFIPDDERLITIEDAAELRLAKPHVVSLEARPANVEGRGEVTVRELVRNALRMRPDRIIVGEVRGGEALDMLQAMNTGHEGSLSTAHANSARHLLWRLETMAMMSDVDLPAAHIRNQVAAAVDVIVHLARLRGGRRVVLEVATVDGTKRGEPVVLPLFRFSPRTGAAGQFEVAGNVPALAATLADRGEDIGPALFDEGADG